jgi:CheY-like chemotaxis protein
LSFVKAFGDCEIIECDNGVEAQVQILMDRKFDLILSDYEMPSIKDKKGDGLSLYLFCQK